MQIGVYGGSFHPPHIGHGMVAAWLGWTRQVDEVWLMPVFDHAFAKSLAPFEDRCRWCEALAKAVGAHVKVCRIEQELDGPSYTAVTLDELRRRHPEHNFRLVVGSDVLPQRSRWHRWAHIEQNYQPLVVGRAGHADVEGAPTFPEVSSTLIRRRLADELAVGHLVPAGVLEALEDSGWGPGDARWSG